MKKMVPLIIFLVVLVIVCFAGCANFSTVLGGDSVTDAEIQSAENAETETVALDVPVTEANGEIVTDAEGNWETTRIYYDVEVTQAASTEQAATNSSDNEAAQSEVSSGQTAETQKSDTSVVVASTNTTEKSDSTSEKVTSSTENTTSGQTTISNEYDILRSGNFYMVGTMYDGSSTLPLEVAITPNTIYMTSEMDGISVGILVDAESKVYMMIPQKQIYLELSDAVMKYMGVSSEDLVSSDTVDFSKYQPLEDADSVNDVELNGTTVKEYVFNESSGDTRVYMNGTKLVRFASYSSDGSLLTASDLTSITGTVPADKSSAPSNYKGYSGITGLIGFMSQMADLME